MAAHEEPVGHDVIRALTRALSDTPETALAELDRVLPAHFADEESEHGFFARMRELGRDPKVIDRLVRDHVELLEQIHALREHPDPDGVAALQQHLKRHEFQESKLEASSPVLSGEHDVPRRWGT